MLQALHSYARLLHPADSTCIALSMEPESRTSCCCVLPPLLQLVLLSCTPALSPGPGPSAESSSLWGRLPTNHTAGGEGHSRLWHSMHCTAHSMKCILVHLIREDKFKDCHALFPCHVSYGCCAVHDALLGMRRRDQLSAPA